MAYFEVILGAFCGLGFFFTYLLYATGGNINGYVVFLLFILSVIFIVDAFRRWNKNRVKKRTLYKGTPINNISNTHTIKSSTQSLSEKQKSDMQRDFTYEAVKRDYEILKDSFEISQSTSNTETFCMRYKLCIEKALSLRIVYNSGFKIFDQMPGMIESVLNAQDTLRSNFLSKRVGEQMTGAETLKTDNGKLNRYHKILSHLENNKSVFEGMEEYNSVCEKIKGRITELSSFTAKDNIIVKNNGKAISNEDIPALIEFSFNDKMQKESEYISGKRTKFTEYPLSANEERFFAELLKALDAVGLNKNKLIPDKLASGLFNLTYDGIYLGKFGEFITPEKFKVIKFGAKRATKVFNTRQEADEYLIGKVGYDIIHIEENCIYDMQIIEDDDIINFKTENFDECLSKIPQYAKYSKKIYKQQQKL